MRTPTMGARAFIPMALAGAVLFTLAPASSGTAAAAEPQTEAQQIIRIAKAQTGDPWRYGAKGPRAFDISFECNSINGRTMSKATARELATFLRTFGLVAHLPVFND